MNNQHYVEQFGRLIKQNEIVFDFDSRDFGFHGINFTGINLARAGYKFEIWYAEGQQSPHLHIKNISGLEGLEQEQLRKFKKLFMRKYTPKKYLQFLDIQLTGKHRIAKENELHYKYNTIKKLCGIWNEDKENFAESELIEEAKQEEKIEVSIDPDAFLLKDKIKITDIARKYGLKVRGNMAICPFHDDKNPSLSLSDEKGVFHCFGCNVSGDIITFYGKLKRLKNG